jgi:hypothetical protein
MQARDKVGNVAAAVTPEPQLIDLSEPEGQLITVRPTPRK